MAKRRRATGVVISRGKVLLVKDKGVHRYSLPGGGIKKNEPPISAAAREIYEETGLSADRIERIGSFSGGTQDHRVFLISKHHGRAHRKSEIADYRWWDGREEILLFDHVNKILGSIPGWSP